MSAEFVLGGRWEAALSHLALFGLALIVEDQTGTEAKVHWARSMRAAPTLTSELASDGLADIVLQHAKERVNGSWVTAVFEHQGRTTAVFSPRIQAPKSAAAWSCVQAARHRELDRIGATDRLDRSLIAALGEPAYWVNAERGDNRPDEGASRWEMKTRNRGEEFVQDRLARLAAAVASRSRERIKAGLQGNVTDEVSKNSVNSRTSTGLTPPQPIDNAMAWCALWGLAAFPTRPVASALAFRLGQTGAASVCAGSHRRRAGTFHFVPVFARPVPPPVIRAVIASQSLARVAASGQREDTADERDWLRSKGVGCLMRFTLNVSDNRSAPERWLSDGGRVPLAFASSTGSVRHTP